MGEALAKEAAMGDVAHRDLANAIRALSMDAVQQANSGHPGMPMGMADVASVLFTRFLKFDAANPDWPDRDRFATSPARGASSGQASARLRALVPITQPQSSSAPSQER